jgi:membrane protein involved in colicin uptake
MEALLAQAEATDAAEEAQYGKGRRGDELPEELARRESRLKKIAQAKAELEQEAREKAEQECAEAEAKLGARREQEEGQAKRRVGANPRFSTQSRLSPTPRHSATSPTRTAASCRTELTRGASCKAITRRRR